MAITKNTDYLRWDANSMKELIVNKLNVDGVYSDQIFEGSDLSVLIDVFSYMFSTLTFLENVGAAEAIFTDAQFYENMNRIVKMLGYNPIGFVTSYVSTFLSVAEGETYPTGPNGLLVVLPKFTTYTKDLTDANGSPIKYSLIEDFAFPINNLSQINEIWSPVFYNGSWKIYPTVFTSAGFPFETFTLNSIADSEKVGHGNIKIYVQEQEQGDWVEWFRYTFPDVYERGRDH